MKEFSITFNSEDGPFFNIVADDFEITNSSYTHRPRYIMFSIGSKIICSIPYHEVYEIARIENDKYLKLQIK